MRMPCQLEIHGSKYHLVGKIRLVREQDCHFSGRNLAEGRGKIGTAFENIINASKPNARLVAFERKRAVHQDWNTVCLKCAHHVAGIGCAIVVAEDCEYSRWRSQFAQELRTRARVLREPVGAATMVFHHRNSDEIAGEYNQIRTKFVHQVHAFADWHDREVIFVMEVAQLSNSESIELMRQMPQANLNPNNFRAVRL